MKLFPENHYEIEIEEPLELMLEKLREQTLRSNTLASDYTEKAFIGKIFHSGFELITSQIGIGAFCVIKGEFDGKKGRLTFSVHSVFKGLMIAMVLLPIFSIGYGMFTEMAPNYYALFFGLVGLVVFVRFVIVSAAFWYSSKIAIERLFENIKIKSLFQVFE